MWARLTPCSTLSSRLTSPEDLLPVPVIEGPLLSIAEHVIRLLDQTELHCRLLHLVRVLVCDHNQTRHWTRRNWAVAPLHLIRVLVWTEPKTLLDQGKLRSGLFYLIRVLVFEVKQTRCEKQLPPPRSVKTKRLIFASVTLFHRELHMSLYHM